MTKEEADEKFHSMPEERLKEIIRFFCENSGYGITIPLMMAQFNLNFRRAGRALIQIKELLECKSELIELQRKNKKLLLSISRINKQLKYYQSNPNKGLAKQKLIEKNEKFKLR